LRLPWLAVMFGIAIACLTSLWAEPLPKLTGITPAGRVHNLTVAEAARAHPVTIRGVATYYDPYIDQRCAVLFVRDSSGCIFVALSDTNATSLDRAIWWKCMALPVAVTMHR
jgi:hypothetical protein